MMYSKGDILQLYGATALVLNDGIKGEEFWEQYKGQSINMLCPDLVCYKRRIWDYDQKIFSGGRWHCYEVMIGDEKSWWVIRIEDSTIKESDNENGVYHYYGNT